MNTATSYMVESLIDEILGEFVEFTFDPRDRIERTELIQQISQRMIEKQIIVLPNRISRVLNRIFQSKKIPGFYTHVNYVKKYVFAGIRRRSQ